MERKHNEGEARSEPEAFISFAERIPGWCVVIGLIGGGQDIHTREGGGIALWAAAIATRAGDWEGVGPPGSRRTSSLQEFTTPPLPICTSRSPFVFPLPLA
jgi:hypothetical protein